MLFKGGKKADPKTWFDLISFIKIKTCKYIFNGKITFGSNEAVYEKSSGKLFKTAAALKRKAQIQSTAQADGVGDILMALF